MHSPDRAANVVVRIAEVAQRRRWDKLQRETALDALAAERQLPVMGWTTDERLERLSQTVGFVGTLRPARLITLMRPDRYVRMNAEVRGEGMAVASGFAIAAQRCPDRPGLIDELGTLTWREIDQRSDALAAALQVLQYGQPTVIGMMARNHHGFVEALIAANRIAADVLLNTSFAGPALAGDGGIGHRTPAGACRFNDC